MAAAQPCWKYPVLKAIADVLADTSDGLTGREIGELLLRLRMDAGEEAIAQSRALSPDVVLMDIRMPGGNGIEATRAITDEPELQGTKVIVLTMFELDEYVYGALRAGASAFLLKDATPERLVDAIRRVHAGESLFAPQVMARLVEHYVAAPRSRSEGRGLDVLTEREREVLGLVAEGLSNDEIAARLVVTIHTVKAHIGALRSKLHARDRAQLVIAAYENGLASRRRP